MFYFTSDLHFHHTNVISYDSRPFDNVEEMNAVLIANWNSIIKPEDIVYVVGDFGFCNVNEGANILQQLQGTKILVIGNHDAHPIGKYYNMGFSLVLCEAIIKCGHSIFKLSHYPYKASKLRQWWIGLTTGKNYAKINKYSPTKGVEDWLLHGHTHGGAVKINMNKRQIHVGCYIWEYKPASINDIFALISRESNKRKLNV